MIDVKEAVQKAIESIGQLLPGENLQDLALEEVEISEDKKYWSVTLGYSVLVEQSPVVSLMGKYARKYKIFKISSETGDVISMKIRNP